MRTILTVIAALWIAACSLPATAGVVYNWIELEGNPELGPMTGRIEIKNEVWKSGEYAFSARQLVPRSIEDFGLVSFFAFAPGMQSPLQLTSVNNEFLVRIISTRRSAVYSGSIRMNSSLRTCRLG